MTSFALLLAAAAAAPADLYAFLSPGESVVLDIGACRVETAHDEAHYRTPVCRLELPASGLLEVKGEVHFERRRVVVDTRFEVVDLGIYTRPLLEGEGDYGQRFGAMIDAFAALAEARGFYAMLERGEPAGEQALREAEQRLGFALPPDFAALLRRQGAVGVGDHAFTGAEDLRPALEELEKGWGETALTPATRAALRDAVVLYTENGDGLGALIYRPGKIDECDGAFYWTHQETINQPELLRNARGECADFAESVYWLLDEHLFEQLDDMFEAPALLLDRAAGPTALVLSLNTWGSDDADRVRLAPRRRGPHSNRTFDATDTPAF